MSKPETVISTKITPLKASRDKLLVLNQILLPATSEWVECKNEKEVAASIQKMHVRGAPAIGIAAAYGFYLGVWNAVQNGKKPDLRLMEKIKQTLDSSRPTAINLFWATAEMLAAGQAWWAQQDPANKKPDFVKLLLELYNRAVAIHEDDAKRCLDMSKIGADYILKHFPKDKYRILTHCNAGALATGGIGTALGLVRVLAHYGKVEMVYVDETRPYLQGARLTAYELVKEKIPAVLSVDSQAAYLMQKGMVDFIIVGSDRITSRGDVANKIGTYGLSVLAKAHKIPFFAIAPLSTFDLSLKDGKDIPIEERDPKEVLEFRGQQVAPKMPVINYSFDVTPNENITAIFNEKEAIARR